MAKPNQPTDPLSKDLNSLSEKVTLNKVSIDAALIKFNKSDLTLSEIEELMVLVKSLQQQMSNQDDSLLRSLSSLRTALSTSITLKRKNSGKKAQKFSEGQRFILGDVTYVVKDGTPSILDTGEK